MLSYIFLNILYVSTYVAQLQYLLGLHTCGFSGVYLTTNIMVHAGVNPFV